MDLRELDAFVAVAEELHFGLAAKRLHVSQPTVTEAVKRLERDLGGQLFDRTTRRVVLTPLGSAFLPEAHAAIAAVTAAYEVGRRRARAQRELLVAFSGNVHQPLHRAILRCRTGLTGAAPIALTQEAPLDGVRGVVARTHDLVVGLLPEALPETLDRIQLRSSRLTAVVPVEDPFAQAGAVSLAQLAMRPLITWPRAYQPGVYDAIEAALDDAVKSWSLVATASHFEGIVSRVMSGQGCALVPSTSVEEPEVLGIACLPVSDDVHFIEYAAWNRQPAHDVLTEFVATLAQECSGQL